MCIAGFASTLAYRRFVAAKRSHVDVLLTDLEPDDLLAIGVLAARGYKCGAMIVGEGSPAAKFARMSHTGILGELGWRGMQVIEGGASAKLFPGESPSDCHLDVAALKLLEVLEKQTYGADASGAGATVVCLKPPREILRALELNRELAMRVFARTTLVLYGSFNLRTMPIDVYSLIDHMTPFKRVELYESHMNRGVQNLNPASVGGVEVMTQWLSQKPLFAAEMWHVCKLWDADVLRDCEESCREEEHAGRRDSARWHRNDKCRTDVRKNEGMQFVPADPIVTLVFDNPHFASYLTPVNIQRPLQQGSYHQIETAESSKVLAWMHLDGSAVVKALNCTLMK
jgi:hypothetical protein